MLCPTMRVAIEDTDNTLHFSLASIWVIAVKSAPGRDDVQIDAHILRRSLLAAGHKELSFEAPRTFKVAQPPRYTKIRSTDFSSVKRWQKESSSICVWTTPDPTALQRTP
jgi:hypothetical protein